ncbi:hypothetical protein DITRI_Ditri02bG0134200 [Diplodiscus trichospermus]
MFPKLKNRRRLNKIPCLLLQFLPLLQPGRFSSQTSNQDLQIPCSRHPYSFSGSEFLEHVDVNKTSLRVGMLVSGAGSVAGCAFLMLALVNVVQIKVGTLACGSGHAYAAVVPLVILVPLALLIYVCVGLYAFTR